MFIGGERRSPEGPSVVDHLVRRNASRRKSDVDCDYLTLTTRAIAERGDLGSLSAGGSKVAGNRGVRAASSALDVAELGGDLHHRGELVDLGAESLQHPPAQRRAALDGDHGTRHRVAHHDLGGPVRGHRHRREAIIRVDRRLNRRAFDCGRDLGERLDVLAVSDQVFAGLELLRELKWHSPGQNDRLLHPERAVFRQIALGDERRRVALGMCRQGQRTCEQTTGQEAERDHRPDPMQRPWAVGEHEIQPPTSRA